jgi:DNA-binding transcriptional MerR regulator
MLPDLESFDLAQLADRAGVSQRTVRYYIQQGLLPSPETRGPGAHYTAEHLDRLRLVRRLQREHLPLAEIRKRLEELGSKEIRMLLERSPERPRKDAREYIRGVLSGGEPMMRSLAAREPAAGLFEEPRDHLHRSKPWGPRPRGQWDRISLTPDIELHIRRPQSREQNRQIERLMEAARHIFEEDFR